MAMEPKYGANEDKNIETRNTDDINYLIELAN